MDREEAIKILDPKTYESTIAKYESYGGFTGMQAKALAVLDACGIAVSALMALPSSGRKEGDHGVACEYCMDGDNVEDCAMLSHDEEDCDRGMYIYNGTLISNSGEFQEAKINFCPMCGRPLSQPKETQPLPKGSLTLDDLLKMDGEPVWVTNLGSATKAGYLDEWALVSVRRRTVESVGMIYRFENYDKTWLAYRERPEKNGIRR